MGRSIMSIATDINDFTWFVHDGHGNIMYSNLSEEKAREISAGYPEYSIGWESNPTISKKVNTRVHELKIGAWHDKE